MNVIKEILSAKSVSTCDPNKISNLIGNIGVKATVTHINTDVNISVSGFEYKIPLEKLSLEQIQSLNQKSNYEITVEGSVDSPVFNVSRK